MEKPRLLNRRQERIFSAHHMLMRAADRAFDAAKTKSPGYLYDMMATITFSALAIESLCNTIGDRIIPKWEDFESSSSMAKLRILTEHLQVVFDPKSEPWITAYWLIKFRNQIAHSKPEHVIEEIYLTQQEHDNRLFDVPESKLEKQITLGNAKRALNATEQIKKILVKQVPADQALGLYVDGWSGSTTLSRDVETCQVTDSPS
jgi:hypothetical protein